MAENLNVTYDGMPGFGYKATCMETGEEFFIGPGSSRGLDPDLSYTLEKITPSEG